jgi:4-hydroxybenzoate polyprenyltransferase
MLYEERFKYNIQISTKLALTLISVFNLSFLIVSLMLNPLLISYLVYYLLLL